MKFSIRFALVLSVALVSLSLRAEDSPSTFAKAHQSILKGDLALVATAMKRYVAETKKPASDLKELLQKGWQPASVPRRYVMALVCPKRGSTSLDVGVALDEQAKARRDVLLEALAKHEVTCKPEGYVVLAAGVPDPKTGLIDLWSMNETGVPVNESAPIAVAGGSGTAPSPVLGADIKPKKQIVYVDRKDLRFDAGSMTAGEVVDVTTKKPQGVALENIKEGSAYALLGFRDHDVLVSVNGHPMKAVSDLKTIEVSAKIAKFHDYKVVRANETTEWRVEFVEGGKAKDELVEEPVKQYAPDRTATVKGELLKTLDTEPSGMRLSPEYKKGGVVRCFRVVNLSPKSAFKRAGLVAGDCIVSLSGKRLDSPASTMVMFDQMRAQIPMTFEVERRGETKRLRIEFE